MRIAILTSEAVPFAKTGGLADVSGALPKALAGHGQDAVLVMPLYQQIDRKHLKNQAMDDLQVEWRGGVWRVGAWFSEAAGAPAFLIDAPHFFQRDSIYGFRDDHERFAFFNRAAIALFRRLGAPPDIVHFNDWPGGFGAVEIWSRRRWDGFFRNTRTVFSIHNMAYQGAFSPEDLWKLGFGEQREVNAFMSNQAASALKAGLEISDMLSTVSRRYSFEIQMRENGYGLDWLLRQRQARLRGITNGVDYDIWSPSTDKHLPAHYTPDNLDGKRECKRALLRHFGLPEELNRPVIANVSRLTSQKGYDLIKQAAGAILDTGAFFVALGSGDKEYENFLQQWRDFAPHRVGIYKGFNDPLAHLIEAGADIFLMPSQFEPCGLNQMYSLRYGTVPVVRAVGGLDDTVEDFNRRSMNGNGFKFQRYNSQAMLEKVHEALFCYAQPEIWRKIQLNGMYADHSWHNAAGQYIQLYEAALRV
jgi:starch synthase